MRTRHFNCRSVLVLPKPRTWWDIKTPNCPNWIEHRQIRRFLASLESRGYIKDGVAVLVIENKADPCQSRIITEKLPEVLTKHERYASIKES